MIRLEPYSTVGLTDKLELPDISELIRFPFCSQTDIDDLYKHAPEDMKYILDRIPLKNNAKYISVNSVTQLLSPKTTSAPRANWHFDGDSFLEESKTTIHLLLSDCEAVTEFTENEIVLEKDEFNENSKVGEVEVFLNQNLHLIEPVRSETSKFITFDGCRHFHRAIRPSKHEFRFMIRVLESNVVEPSKFENSIFHQSYVFDDGISDYSKIDLSYIMENKTKEYLSIDKSNDNKVEFYYN
jgi:hypothetical protein